MTVAHSDSQTPSQSSSGAHGQPSPMYYSPGPTGEMGTPVIPWASMQGSCAHRAALLQLWLGLSMIHTLVPSPHLLPPPSYNGSPRIRSGDYNSLASYISIKCSQEKTGRGWGEQNRNGEKAKHRWDSSPASARFQSINWHTLKQCHWPLSLPHSVLCYWPPQGECKPPGTSGSLYLSPSSSRGPRSSSIEGHWG